MGITPEQLTLALRTYNGFVTKDEKDEYFAGLSSEMQTALSRELSRETETPSARKPKPESKSKKKTTTKSKSSKSSEKTVEAQNEFDKAGVSNITVGKDGLVSFHRTITDKDGKTKVEEINKKTKAPDAKTFADEGTYVTKEDFIATLNEKAKAGKTTVQFTGANGKPVKIKVKAGKELSEKQVKQISEALAKQASITLPANDKVNVGKNGWFTMKSMVKNEKGELVEGKEAKVQMSKDKRESFMNADAPTTMYNTSDFKIDEVSKPAEVKTKCKSKVPGWVKAVGIVGGIAAGVAVAGLMAPAIMPACSTLWFGAGPIGQAVLHATNVGLAAVSNALVGGGLSFATSTGIWATAGGAVANGLMASAGSAAMTLAAGALGSIGAGVVTNKLIQKIVPGAGKALGKVTGTVMSGVGRGLEGVGGAMRGAGDHIKGGSGASHESSAPELV